MSTKNVISKNGVWKTAPLNDTPSSGGVLVVTDTDGTLDKTWQEIHDAFLTGAVRITRLDSVITNITRIYSITNTNTFIVEYVFNGKSGATFGIYETNSADGYPTLSV